MEWEEDALKRLEKVHPQMRGVAKFRIEEYARKREHEEIEAPPLTFVARKLISS